MPLFNAELRFFLAATIVSLDDIDRFRFKVPLIYHRTTHRAHAAYTIIEFVRIVALGFRLLTYTSEDLGGIIRCIASCL